MGSVVERLFVPGGEYPLNFHDRPITFESVEKRYRLVLDRRKKYAVKIGRASCRERVSSPV